MAQGVRLRVVIRAVSLIGVRSIDVPLHVSLPLLNHVLLACFDWSGEPLHEFEIRGRRYSTSRYVDAEPSGAVTVESLGLRLGDGFGRQMDREHPRWSDAAVPGWPRRSTV